jgi:hypothetical protein
LATGLYIFWFTYVQKTYDAFGKMRIGMTREQLYIMTSKGMWSPKSYNPKYDTKDYEYYDPGKFYNPKISRYYYGIQVMFSNSITKDYTDNKENRLNDTISKIEYIVTPGSGYIPWFSGYVPHGR